MTIPWATCPECSANMRGKSCRACGYEIPKVDRSPQTGPKRCTCGSSLDATGTCLMTGCYPGWLEAPPVSCPFCRGPLSWHGGCLRCYGTLTPSERESWSIPGDYYVLRDQHYQKVATGPRKVCSKGENLGAKRILDRVWLGQVTVEQALGLLDEAMDRHGGIPEDEAWPDA